MIKTRRVNGKEVTIAGVTHLPTEDDKKLGGLIEESDVVGIEGGNWWWSFEDFVGERGERLIHEESKHIVELDVIKSECEDEKKGKYFSFRKERESKVFPFLLDTLSLAHLPFSIYENLFHKGNYRRAYRRGKIYRKLVDLEGDIISLFTYPVYTVRDVGMGYVIKSLAEEYDRILAVVGWGHLHPVSRLLDAPEKLERQFKRFSPCFKDEARVRMPVKEIMTFIYGDENLRIQISRTLYDYPVVRRIPLKQRGST